jgi:hypothetical protein
MMRMSNAGNKRSINGVLLSLLGISQLLVACGGGGGHSPGDYSIGGTVSGLAGSGLVLQDNAGDDLPIASDGTFAFKTTISGGSDYAVTVKSQPVTPAQSCVVTDGSGAVGGANITTVGVTCTATAYAVGGTVNGLLGSGLVLQDNGGNDLPIAANGSFVFTAPIASGAAYVVTAKVQPTAPAQTCALSGGSGTIANANVVNVAVTCTTNTYKVGGTVNGLLGSGLILQDNGGNDLAIAANGSFVFTTPVAIGAAYVVTAKVQPTAPAQTCALSGASGTIANANVVNVAVTCTTNTYKVGGTVNGLLGSGLILQDNGGNDLAIAANGSFVFTSRVASALSYAVSVSTQPAAPAQTCVLSGATGSITNSDVTGVVVTCTMSPSRFAYVAGAS